MSAYDVVRVGEQEGQVKLWHNELDTFTVGSSVLDWRGNTTYDIAMREGGVVHVRDLKIVGWDDSHDPDVHYVDKWGDEWGDFEPNTGLLGEVYHFKTGGV